MYSTSNAICSLLYFFFQAEDGIRDLTVTGVQTCALPIFSVTFARDDPARGWAVGTYGCIIATTDGGESWTVQKSPTHAHLYSVSFINKDRSEERRVGKECRSRWSPYH